MKLNELVDKLKGFNSELDVLICDEDGENMREIEDVSMINNPRCTPAVVIS